MEHVFCSFLKNTTKKKEKMQPKKLKLPFLEGVEEPGNSNIINRPVHYYLCKELSLGSNSRTCGNRLP